MYVCVSLNFPIAVCANRDYKASNLAPVRKMARKARQIPIAFSAPSQVIFPDGSQVTISKKKKEEEEEVVVVVQIFTDFLLG
jgi:hypothetical protein